MKSVLITGAAWVHTIHHPAAKDTLIMYYLHINDFEFGTFATAVTIGE